MSNNANMRRATQGKRKPFKKNSAAKRALAAALGVDLGLRKRGNRRKGNRNRPTGPGGKQSFRTGRLGLSGSNNRATSRRAQTIEEDEYIGEVLSSTGFATTQYSANPGQPNTFPWGNRISQLYEEYEFEFLEFYYKREVSEFATAGTVGKVMLSFDYDASDIAPTTKQIVEDTVPHADGMPADPVIRLPIDCARMKKNPGKFVRPGAQPANTDIKTYDCGNLYVSTSGNQSTGATLGELHVRYRVKLSEPILEAGIVQGGAMHFTSLTASTANNFAGAVLQPGASSQLIGNIKLSTANTVTFGTGIPGNYFLALSVSASSSVGIINYGSVTGGVSALPDLFDASGVTNAANYALSNAGSTVYAAMISIAVNVTNAGGTLVITPGAVSPGSLGGMDLFVFQLPSTILSLSGPLRKEAELEKRLILVETALRNSHLKVDSDFDDEEQKSSLSQSTSDLIGELILRKAASNKK